MTNIHVSRIFKWKNLNEQSKLEENGREFTYSWGSLKRTDTRENTRYVTVLSEGYLVFPLNYYWILYTYTKYIRVFKAAISIITQKCKQSKCSSTEEWINKL